MIYVNDNGTMRLEGVNKDEPSKIEGMSDLFSNIDVSLFNAISDKKVNIKEETKEDESDEDDLVYRE